MKKRHIYVRPNCELFADKLPVLMAAVSNPDADAKPYTNLGEEDEESKAADDNTWNSRSIEWDDDNLVQ